MRKTPLSLALLAAFAVAGPAAVYAQTSSDNPDNPPPAGPRIPAAAGNPQHSGDTSSDSSNTSSTSNAERNSAQTGATSSSMASQPATMPQSNQPTGTSSATSGSSSNTQQSGASSESQHSAASGGQSGASTTMSGANQSGQTGMQGSQSMPQRGGSRGMSGQAQPSLSDQHQSQAQSQYDPRVEAWRRWHERMAQQGWMPDQRSNRRAGEGNWGPRDRYSDRDDYYANRDYYSDQGRWANQGRWSDQDHWSNQNRWSDHSRWSDQDRWARSWTPGAMGQAYPDTFGGRDYYSDRSYWSGPRYGRGGFEDRWGPRYREDYADRGGQWQRQGPGSDWMSRGPSYDDNYYQYREPYRGGRGDWGARERWRMQGQQGYWGGDMADRDGRWYGEGAGEGSAMGDRSDRWNRPYYGGDNRGFSGPESYQGGPSSMRGERYGQGGEWQGGPSFWQGMGQRGGEPWDRYGANEYSDQGTRMQGPPDRAGMWDGQRPRYIPFQAEISGERSPLAPNMEGEYQRNLPGTGETVTGQESGMSGATNSSNTARSNASPSAADQYQRGAAGVPSSNAAQSNTGTSANDSGQGSTTAGSQTMSGTGSTGSSSSSNTPH
ncbi:MAG TPA: hypothetical protein VFA81_12865 [Burkholderiales bacterium]|nr:hypothetical protein [Burkholderiales bacterium]